MAKYSFFYKETLLGEVESETRTGAIKNAITMFEDFVGLEELED